MRIYKYKQFHNWAKSEGLSDETLLLAVDEIAKGLLEANLGGGLYKKRIPGNNGGKRGGYRTLLAFKEGDKTFFIYGFSKNERENISIKEQLVFKKLAGYYLKLTEFQIKILIEGGELIEVIP